jgi:rod shape-determining protein MreC
VRNGLRSVVFGLGNGQLELRFMPANADVQIGDLLVTSGLDGIWLPGTPGGQSCAASNAIPHTRLLASTASPSPGVENFGEVMVLDPRETIPLPTQN